MSPSHQIKVLVVGDSTTAESLDDVAGVTTVESSGSASVATELTSEFADIDCLLLAQDLQNESWEPVMGQITDQRPSLPCVLLVSEDFESAMSAAIAGGAIGCLPDSICQTKPSMAVSHLRTLIDSGTDPVRETGDTQ